MSATRPLRITVTFNAEIQVPVTWADPEFTLNGSSQCTAGFILDELTRIQTAEPNVCMLCMGMDVQVHEPKPETWLDGALAEARGAEMKIPLELVRKGREDREPVAYACGKCGVVTRTRDEAAAHCAPKLCECGAPVKQYCTVCQQCWTRKAMDREAARIAKAKRVSWREWDGPVYCDGLGSEYFADIDGLLDELTCGDYGLPLDVWACTEERIALDATAVVEQVLDEHHEDALDYVDIPSLQVVLDAWCAAQSLVSWHPRDDLIVDMEGAVSS